MIGKQTNYDDNFFRMVSASLAKTLTRCITWINYFDDKKIRVVVPFYLSLSGNEKFLLDAFVDDVVDKRVELNTDQIPRGIINFNGFNSDTNALANPNQYISKKTVINDKMRSFIQKTKAIPVKLNYDIEIVVMTEIDTFKLSEKILNMLFNYMYFNIDYNGIKIDASFNLPDEKSVEIERNHTLESETKKYIKFSLTVNTYYPSFLEDTDDYIICDNDDDIDWSRMCKTRPSEKNINDLNGTRKVYWKNYIWDKDFIGSVKPDGKDRWDDTPKENF